MKKWVLIGKPRKEMSTISGISSYMPDICRLIHEGDTRQEVETFAETNKEDGFIVEVHAQSTTETVKYHKIKPLEVEAVVPHSTGVYR